MQVSSHGSAPTSAAVEAASGLVPDWCCFPRCRWKWRPRRWSRWCYCPSCRPALRFSSSANVPNRTFRPTLMPQEWIWTLCCHFCGKSAHLCGKPAFSLQYIGKWYEIQKLPTAFQKGQCSTATYTAKSHSLGSSTQSCCEFSPNVWPLPFLTTTVVSHFLSIMA